MGKIDSARPVPEVVGAASGTFPLEGVEIGSSGGISSESESAPLLAAATLLSGVDKEEAPLFEAGALPFPFDEEVGTAAVFVGLKGFEIASRGGMSSESERAPFGAAAGVFLGWDANAPLRFDANEDPNVDLDELEDETVVAGFETFGPADSRAGISSSESDSKSSFSVSAAAGEARALPFEAEVEPDAEFAGAETGSRGGISSESESRDGPLFCAG